MDILMIPGSRTKDTPQTEPIAQHGGSGNNRTTATVTEKKNAGAILPRPKYSAWEQACENMTVSYFEGPLND
jgi:hypothetical protein